MSDKLETLRKWLKSECKLDYSVEELTNLTTFYLSYNNLTQVPQEIGQLINLKELYLSSNNLTQVPLEIANINLYYFYCDKVFVRKSDKNMVEFLNKNKQEYQIAQETLLTDVLI